MNWAARKVLFIILASLGFFGASNAAVLESYMVRDWNLYAYSDDTTNEFTHCAMAASYKNGIVLIFLIDRSKDWYMALANENWNLTPGKRYNFDIMLDGVKGSNWFGVAVNANMLRVPLADSAALFEQFSRAIMMTINAANETYRFKLDNSRVALAEVAACTARYLASTPASRSNPFERAPKVPAAGESDAFYSEGTAVMTKMLAAIRSSGYRLLTLEDLKKSFRGYHAVWVGTGAAGSLKVLPTTTSAAELATQLLASASADCKGKFDSGKSVQGQALKIATICEDKTGKVLNDHYIIIPRAAGGFYLFSVVATDQDEASINRAARVGDLMLASARK